MAEWKRKQAELMERHEEAEEKIRIARKKLSELRGTYGARMSIEEWYELVSVVESVQEREVPRGCGPTIRKR